MNRILLANHIENQFDILPSRQTAIRIAGKVFMGDLLILLCYYYFLGSVSAPAIRETHKVNTIWYIRYI